MSKWKDIISSVAPSVATALGGPFAGMATKMLANKLMGKESITNRELETALADPDSLVKIRELENEFTIKMRELGIEEKSLTSKDRQNARSMASSTSIKPQVVLSVVLMLGFFISFWFLVEMPENMDDQTKMIFAGMFGALTSYVSMMLKFWFGGSPSDEINQQNLYNSIPKRAD